MISNVAAWSQAIQLLFGALWLCFAYFVARYGVAHFNKVFAAVIFATGIAGALLFASLGGNLFSTDNYSLFYWGMILGFAAAFLVFGRFFSHVAMFMFGTLLVIAMGRVFGLEASPALAISGLAISAVVTFALRRHTIKVLVGTLSGLYVSQTVYTVLSLVVGNSVSVYDPQSLVNATKVIIVLIAAVPVIFIALGILVQYLWHERIFGGKAIKQP